MNPTVVPSRVVGLYSFPKSGNTWLRNIIAAMVGIPHDKDALQRYVTDSHYGPVMEDPWNFKETDWYFYKSHRKSLLKVHHNQSFTTDRIVYIYRHPLDVFVSYLNFVSNNVDPAAGESLGVSFDKVEDLTPDQMERLFSLFLDKGTLFPQNRQFGSIFENINSFFELRETAGNVHILRYEDLFDDFHAQVGAIADFVGLGPVDSEKIFAQADRGTARNGKFFWKRQKENFRNYLTQDQIDRFWLAYGDLMIPLGYQQ